MGVVVFDSDVLIGFLNASDPHHEAAGVWMREALAAGIRRQLCAVNYSEILVGPARAGRQVHVREMIARLTIEVVQVDAALAERAAGVRARTGLKLPDAFALATAGLAEGGGSADVRLASFDGAVVRAHETMAGGGPG